MGGWAGSALAGQAPRGRGRPAPRCPAGVCFAVAGPALRDPHSPLFCELNFNLGCLDFMGFPSRLPQILATLCVCVLEAPRWPPAALRLRREQGWRSHRLGPGNAVWDLPSANAE